MVSGRLIAKSMLLWLAALGVGSLLTNLSAALTLASDSQSIVRATYQVSGLIAWLVPGVVSAFRAKERRALHAAIAGSLATLLFVAAMLLVQAAVDATLRIFQEPWWINGIRFVLVPVLVPVLVGAYLDHRKD